MKKVATPQASSPLDNLMEEVHSFSAVAGFACFQHTDTGTLVYTCIHLYMSTSGYSFSITVLRRPTCSHLLESFGFQNGASPVAPEFQAEQRTPGQESKFLRSFSYAKGNLTIWKPGLYVDTGLGFLCACVSIEHSVVDTL